LALSEPASGLGPSEQSLSIHLPELPAPPPLKNSAFVAARVLLSPLLSLFYRIRVRGQDGIPPSGPALIVCNHVSFLDAVLIAFAARRPVRFLMFKGLFDSRLFGWFYRLMGAIPVSPSQTRKEMERSLGTARAALKAGELVAIFPEGALTLNGNMRRFRRGFELISEGLDAPVVTAHVDGLWGSLLSHYRGGVVERLRDLPRPVILRFGGAPRERSAQAAREAISELGAQSMRERVELGSPTLARAFLRTAKARGGRLAMADSTGKELSFSKALTASLLLAGALRGELADRPLVGVLLPPSAGGALANLALAEMGRVSVNLNYTASAEALAYAVEKSELEEVLTSRSFLKKLEAKGMRPEIKARLMFIEDILEGIPAWRRTLTHLALRVLPRFLIEAVYLRGASRSLDDTAAVLFTSGSSGLPKGVELTHLNVQSDLEMTRELFRFSPRDLLLSALPLFHSFGLTAGLWMPMIFGFGAAYHPNPLEYGAIGKLASRRRPTLLLGTPTFLAGYAKKIPAEAFAGLRIAMAGAEKLRPETAAAFEEKFGLAPLEGYGATELSPVAAVNMPDAKGQPGTKEGSVGQPLPGVAVRVADLETGEPMPDGKDGMLLFKGPNVMKGYLGEPLKTAEAVRDGWFVSGDVGRVDRDGFIFVTGRLKRFSKIGPEMVSHEAVEEKLQLASGARETAFVVAGVPDEKNGERLVALYTGWEGDVGALLSKAKALGLPALWTPSKDSFHKIDKIPLLGSGKLDIQALQKLALLLASGASR
jgi:acyl-[acyl-carrier-protein]-phospholipid O-acyltransferase/long-chain-fatty-acid--[acyl-carrier-protein] ligase